jgi:hypothetical protein
VDEVLRRYFGAQLAEINFDERCDLEIRAQLAQRDYGSSGESVGVTSRQGQGMKHLTIWKDIGVGGPPSGRWSSGESRRGRRSYGWTEGGRLPPRGACHSVYKPIPENDRQADKKHPLLVGQLPCLYRRQRPKVSPEDPGL